MKPDTLLNQDPVHPHGAAAPPLHQTSTFGFDSWDAIDAAFDDRTGTAIYSRQMNPTVSLAEEKLAALAGAERARLFGSGMAAISAAILHCLSAGDHIITLTNVYGPARSFMSSYLPEKTGCRTTFVGGTVEDVREAWTDRTRLVYLESPSSAVFGLQDIEAVSGLAHERGARVIVDNTWATPVFQKTLALGADLEVHSASKYLCGHSDVVAGAVLGSRADLDALAVREGELLGAKMAPFEAWLMLRSLRTLPARMRQHQESAFRVAEYLEQHRAVRTVRYPGLPSFPQAELAARQMSGFTALMGFQLATDDIARVKRFFDGLRLFNRAVSWGGHDSLVYAPAISYAKEHAPERFAEMGISAGDIRISVGLEDAEDLIADLEQALSRI
ncbi:MAG: aminotransferase class I/II-fold pyridoxal phosphate-dependent enzyme [Rhodothermales bacterium]|nr:aminotransferase class I/II-fold pyridoxal phosphate-dependent enzyme [Rhodothermales bacterium]MBO6779220.1 aminotransferase class I/II-fold pyridoxal phosphate-dependent enzyme [Rhodothermales bacterium]